MRYNPARYSTPPKEHNMFGFLARLFKRRPQEPAQAAPPPQPPAFDLSRYADEDGLQMDDGELGDNVSFDDDSPLTAEQIQAVSKQTGKK